MSSDMVEKSPADLSLLDWVCFIGILIVGVGTFFMMQWYSHVENERADAYSSLLSKSPAHAFIVPAYRECERSRDPAHISCTGTVAKSAELKGFSDIELVRVFNDIKALNAQYD